uniref:Uncharacterized protein n=1 Tax=Cucumis melo TaxID=3656 RepID=A0A9I9EHS5_CUCME
MTRRNLFSFEPYLLLPPLPPLPSIPGGQPQQPSQSDTVAAQRQHAHLRLSQSFGRFLSHLSHFAAFCVVDLKWWSGEEHFEMVEDVESKPESFNSCCKVWKDLCTKLEEKRIALRQATKLLNEQCKRIEVENRNLKRGRMQMIPCKGKFSPRSPPSSLLLVAGKPFLSPSPTNLKDHRGSSQLQSPSVSLLYLERSNRIHVEDVEASRKLSESETQLEWFLKAVSDLLRGSEDKFFQKPGEVDRGRLKVLKFKARSGWVLSCVFWPSFGGHSNLRNTSASLPSLAGRFKSKEVIGDTSLARKSDNQGQWVIRNAEVATTNFESLWIVTKVFAFDDWQMIRKSLEEYFQAKIVINPLFGENAFISIDQDSIKDSICEEGKWQAMGSFHLKFEKWNKLKHFISTLKNGTKLNTAGRLL